MNQNEARPVRCSAKFSLIINFAVYFSATLSKGALAQNLDESGEIIRIGKTKAAISFSSPLNTKINLKSSKTRDNNQSEIDFIRQTIEEKENVEDGNSASKNQNSNARNTKKSSKINQFFFVFLKPNISDKPFNQRFLSIGMCLFRDWTDGHK